VDDASRTIEKLREENETLRAALRLAEEERDRERGFLAVAAHELRNPITPIVFAVDLLLEQAAAGALPDDGVLVRRLAMFGRQVSRLRTDLDRLLDFSRIRRGKLSLELEELDLAAVVADVLDELQPQIEASGCVVRRSLEGPVIGRWDRMRLRHVAWNLISNATKFGANAPIEVEVAARESRATLRVSDHGPGVPEDVRARLFDLHERGAAEQPHTGFGVGLWLVRQITEAHGGTVRCEGAPGAGATFIVDLPRRSP
jgi:signal transduction histidine kinase